MNILHLVKIQRDQLSKAEAKVADEILAAPDDMINMPTAELARRAGVSDPMVSRFCRSLGCNSFPEFKVQLAKALAHRASFISESVFKGDPAHTVIEKRINANQAALEYLRSHLDASAVDAAVQAMGQARQIIIAGMGGAAAIAQDAQHKLFRLGIPTVAYDDHLMMRMAAAGASTQDCFLAFSVTGRTTAMIEIAELAKQSGATLIAITTPESPLAALSDITITSGNELEDTTIYVPMTTRIIILTIIDIISTALALAQGPEIEAQLKKVKHSLDGTKLELNTDIEAETDQPPSQHN
ncbi:HTH-type transcriptional regulator HexR [Zhongshania aliphaticivorans]|uniref:HTH-type transcriptional regulator HexR n=1 Tax=Zhongshania aliphaticivorans TaxID=1470434 RepID=A0A5S9P4U2_9GAMM|nr:SIS domain-containing protein [Zhongshania aliphaticivorans]CAA0090934.1 HTH-type transcriptional regulator HexR [Zhongshania aliphaticivorans]CAA0098443.1 HTH-type transcriptional regulator HexR [Zhongshania aliphaticivorans]